MFRESFCPVSFALFYCSSPLFLLLLIMFFPCCHVVLLFIVTVFFSHCYTLLFSIVLLVAVYLELLLLSYSVFPPLLCYFFHCYIVLFPLLHCPFTLFCWLLCILNYTCPTECSLGVIKLALSHTHPCKPLTYIPTLTPDNSKSGPSAITSLIAQFTIGLISDFVICKQYRVWSYVTLNVLTETRCP